MDYLFHLVIVKRCPNPYLVEIIENLKDTHRRIEIHYFDNKYQG